MSRITIHRRGQTFMVLMELGVKPRMTENSNIVRTRNTAGMTSQGCFVEFVLEHEP